MADLNATLSYDMETYDYDVDNDYVYVDSVTREVTISNSSKLFGTQYDKDSVLIKFRALNVVSEVFRLSDSIVRINWKDSANQTGTTITINGKVNGDFYEFDWLIPAEALKKGGYLRFVVKANTLVSGTSEIDKIWGSKLAQIYIPESIYVKVSTITQTEKDEIAEMLLLVDSKVSAATLFLENSKNDYLTEIKNAGDSQVSRLSDIGLYVDSEGYIVQEVDD